MTVEFDPIVIRYDGLEADGHVIDLGMLGQSIQGAARLLGSAGSIVVTGHFIKQTPSFAVRVLARPPEAHCFEIIVHLDALAPVGMATLPIFPIIQDGAKKVATKAVTGIVNYALSKLSGKKSEMELAQNVAIKALEEMGQTSRAAFEAMERMSASQRSAIKLFVAPIGEACSVARIGDQANGAVLIDTAARAVIDAPEDIEIGETSEYEVLITEFDIKNRSCKLSFRDQEEAELRVVGEITDPAAQLPKNPYSTALDNQRWIWVRAKAQMKQGEIEKLYISDLAPRSLPVSAI